MDLTFYISAFVALFVIIDPIGLAPLFLAMTHGTKKAERRAIGRRAILLAFFLLMLFGLLGDAVLGFIGISIPAFRIAGGILLFLTALDMLFERRTKRRDHTAEEEERPDPSVFPLAIPLLAGPGAITTMILLVGQAGSPVEAAGVFVVMALVLAVVALMFRSAGLLERALGRTGTVVATRLLGMLLAALSVQFVLDGLRGAGMIATTVAG
ncbi:MarC family protein [Aliiruegeria sabulilitoris]|uniref:MarC family protein n=1 Tax=Aliiruegeria sabulilitoris TaxID=1510458 RepID=UPI000830F3F4|nr:MarC family protein [Aliiruegeria sabulilitoris]NDR56085.1 NAAT family transporter [Pseudoruegeria sp. M32A2M]